MKNITSTIFKSGVFYAAFIPAAALATAQDGADAAKPAGTPDCLFVADKCNTPVFQTIANVLIFLIGAIAVIMLIFGGLRYVISSGDAARVKAAKDTILYAVIGLVVAILAYAIVKFLTTNIK